MHTIKRSFYLRNYEILLVFDDEKVKIVDLENEIWGPVFQPLKDVEYFKKVKVKGGTIAWPNDADFCPDVLYMMGKEIPPQKKISQRNKKAKISKALRIQSGRRKIKQASL